MELSTELPDPSSPVLHGFILDGHGGGNYAQGKELTEALKDDRPAWVHLDGTHPQVRDWLVENIGYLDRLILDALLREETRPRLSAIDNGALIILRGVNLNEGAEPEDMIAVRLWADQNRLITVRRRPLKAILDIRSHLHENKGPASIGDLIADLSLSLYDRMEPVIDELADLTDTIEDNLLDKSGIKDRNAITDIRQDATTLRRYIAPQRDVMGQLRNSDLTFLSFENLRAFHEAYDRTSRFVEELDEIRERAQIMKDEIANALSDKLNKNLYILSIISAIFLPLGFLTGLMGINIGGMPGVEDPNAFWIFSYLLIGLIAIEIILFKLLKWF